MGQMMGSAEIKAFAFLALVALGANVSVPQGITVEQPQQPHDVLGRISSISLTEIDIQTSTNPKLVFARTVETLCSDVHNGDLVKVIYVSSGSSLTAKSVISISFKSTPSNPNSGERLGLASAVDHSDGKNLPHIQVAVRASLAESNKLSAFLQKEAEEKIATNIVGTTIDGKVVDSAYRVETASDIDMVKLATADAVVEVSGRETTVPRGSLATGIVSSRGKVSEKALVILDTKISYGPKREIISYANGMGTGVGKGADTVLSGDDSTSSHAAQSAALAAALIELLSKLQTSNAPVPTNTSIAAAGPSHVTASYEALVVESSGREIVLTAGSDKGVMVGDIIAIYRPRKNMSDPDTGLSSKDSQTFVGRAEVTEVSQKDSKAICIEGEKIMLNDRIRPVK